MKVWMPSDVAGALRKDLPEGVEVDVYDGSGSAPASIDTVEFYVPPFFVDRETTEVVRSMRRLRVVQALTAGVDPLVPYVPDGVALCNARGVHDASTAEWVLAAMLATLREFPRFVLAQQAGRWDYQFTDVLAEKTVLIVGYGSIGAAVERRLSGFEVEVVRVARHAREGVAPMTELDALLPRADVVVLLVPFTAETRGLVDAAFLGRMRDGALLVNAARGPVVDTGALLAELESGRLRAALDVTDPEPLPDGHPLWQAPGLLLTPHVAGSTQVSGRRVLGFLRAQLERYLASQPLHNVVHGTY